jgi:catechol 2,3-dioxygenase
MAQAHIATIARRMITMSAALSGKTEPLLESHRSLVHIGSVSLVVRDLDRLTTFYRDVIGMTVLREEGDRVDLGNDGVTLLSLVGDPQAASAPEGAPGLFHTAFLLPERRHLGEWLATAAKNGWALEGMADHLVSEALYLSDPEGNGIEIYRDRPRAEWTFDAEGKVRMANRQIDVPGLLALTGKASPGKAYRMPLGARVGHVHLCVNALEAAAGVIEKQWGLSVMCRYPGATFFGAGGYHHHIATNVWRTSGQQSREEGQTGLAGVSLVATPEAQKALAATWLESGGKEKGGVTSLTTLDGLRFSLT